MTDEDPVPARNAPDYESHLSNDPTRAFLAVHYVTDPDGSTYLLAPAQSITVGHVKMSEDGDEHPVIRVISALAPSGLVFLPSISEMRRLAARLTEFADRKEKEVADLASAALDKAMGKRS